MPTWGGMRNKLEKDYLCPALRGHIQYFATSYSKCPDHEGRAAVRLDGEEVLKSNYYEACLAEWNASLAVKAAHPEASRQEQWRLSRQETLNDGGFDQREFYSAFQEFDNQAIEKSLCSPNPLVRMFALLDRRVGKRRLRSLRETMEWEPEWFRFFYALRLKAEGMEVGGSGL